MNIQKCLYLPYILLDKNYKDKLVENIFILIFRSGASALSIFVLSGCKFHVNYFHRLIKQHAWLFHIDLSTSVTPPAIFNMAIIRVLLTTVLNLHPSRALHKSQPCQSPQ